MSGHLAKDRARAVRIRKKLHPSATERHWLREYDRTRKRTGPFVAGQDPRVDANTVQPSGGSLSSSTSSPSPSPAPSPVAPAATDEVPPGHVPVSFPDAGDPEPDANPNPGPQGAPGSGSDAGPDGAGGGTGGGPAKKATPLYKDGGEKPYHTPGAAIAPPMSCGIAGCPGCTSATGGYVCTTTGKTIWPPMAEASAEAVGAGFLATISLAGKMIRKDGAFIVPSEQAQERMTKAIIAVTYRRINAIGAIDDLLQLGAVVVMHGVQVARADAPKKPDGAK